MDKLEKDQLFLLALELDLPELLSFCDSSKRINELICKRNDIWYYKLNKEFPNWKDFRFNASPKKIYILLKNGAKMEFGEDDWESPLDNMDWMSDKMPPGI